METKQSNNSATPMADAVKIANQRALFNLEWENDTVFKKRELNYKTKAAFQKDLEAGKISKYTTVFIKDSKEIYKNGQYYGNSEGSVVSGNFTECMQVNSELSTEIFSNLKPPFGKQTTFTPSEGLKNLLINNVSKNISLITFDYGGENITFSANITGDSQVVILTMNIHTLPALFGFGTGFSLITIQLDIESNSVTITALPVPCLSSEATGNSFFCDDGQFKKIDSLAGFDEISLSQDIVDGSTNSGNFTEEEYNKILAASGKGFIIVNLNGAKLLSNVSKNVLEGKVQLTLSIGQMVHFEGVVLLANNIIIKDKSENYAFISSSFTTNIYNGADSHIKINTNQGTDESVEIDLIVNGDGTKFLANDGTYKDSNIYFLPEKILDLERESTSDDFLAVFGGIDNLKDVLNKSLNGKILAVKRNSTALKHGGTQTISTNILQFTSAYFVSLRYFIPKNTTDMSTIFREIKFIIDSSGAKISSFNIKDAYHGGYRIPANVYTLSDKSTSDDILRVFGTGDSFKKLILAIIDGNRILINGTPRDGEEVVNIYGEYINNVETIACKIFDNGNMTLTLKIFLCAYIAVQTSILIVEYSKSENKFSCKINNI